MHNSVNSIKSNRISIVQNFSVIWMLQGYLSNIIVNIWNLQMPTNGQAIWNQNLNPNTHVTSWIIKRWKYWCSWMNTKSWGKFQEYKNFIMTRKKIIIGTWRDCTMGRALALHILYLSFIPNIAYIPMSNTRSKSWAQDKDWGV